MRHPIRRTTVLLATLLLLSGCADRDPYRRTDVWQPTGANAANLAAMVANPHDLAVGHGSSRNLSKAQAAAVDRVWQGTPTAVGGGAASGGGGGTTGGSGG